MYRKKTRPAPPITKRRLWYRVMCIMSFFLAVSGRTERENESMFKQIGEKRESPTSGLGNIQIRKCVLSLSNFRLVQFLG